MEDILAKLGSAAISSEVKSEKSDFESLYKNWGKLSNQEERRKEILENQKNNRHCKLDKLRGILEIVNAAEDTNVFKQDHHKRAHYRPNIYVAGFNSAPLTYKNILMLSEWMIERPDDFNEDWYVSPCPKGVRMLVVANCGKTKCYTKYGQFRLSINTALPGGNGNPENHNINRCCVLDCFYEERTSTMFVIDFLAWNNQPMTDCDTEFRYFWLQSQFAEKPELGVINKKNKVRFVLLPKVSCTPEELNKVMMTWPHFEDNFPALDGFLFYHKKAHYISGQTPLVGWLFPYMVPEVLGADITVHSAYLQERPKDYVDQATFIKYFEEKYAKRDFVHGKTKKKNAMDTSDVSSSENAMKEVNQAESEMDSDEVLPNTTYCDT